MAAAAARRRARGTNHGRGPAGAHAWSRTGAFSHHVRMRSPHKQFVLNAVRLLRSSVRRSRMLQEVVLGLQAPGPTFCSKKLMNAGSKLSSATSKVCKEMGCRFLPTKSFPLTQ